MTFTQDDIFVLGNIAAKAVVTGHGDAALGVLRFLQDIRPENAGAYLMEAMHLSSVQGPKAALQFLEAAPVFSAEVNRDEAIAFHLVLIQECGESERALRLGEAYLAENLLISDSAIQLVERLVNDLRATRPAEPART